MNPDLGWLALRLVPGVGARTIHRLMQQFGSPEGVFAASREHLSRVPGLTNRTVDAIRSFPAEKAAQKEMARLHTLGMHIIRWGTRDYPDLLANISDPPPILYVKGELLPEDERSVAVVGSRRASAYGLSVCRRLCAGLAWQGWTVVSGMARGIDSAAHLGALETGGRTLAILGTGLDVVYPRENRKLSQRIAASGALVSEFPLGTPPEPGNFPIRNRIISGLALGVVVVEATAKSGSLITARMALEQDRQVFAIPGQIDQQSFAGPHRLIKEGAKLVEGPEDIVDELSPMISRKSPARVVQREEVLHGAHAEMGERERMLWSVLGTEPLHIDDITRKLDLSVSQTAELLLRLEIKGLIRQLPGTFFVREFAP